MKVGSLRPTLTFGKNCLVLDSYVDSLFTGTATFSLDVVPSAVALL